MRWFKRRSTAVCARLGCIAALVLIAGFAAPGHAGTLRAKHVLRIWPLGDSITVGSTGIYRPLGAHNRTPGGYRATLDDLLSDSRVWHQFVGTSQRNQSPSQHVRGQQWHDGHGGYRIDEVFTDLNGLAGGTTDDGGYWLTGIAGVRAPIYPNVVIIHLGTNDIVQRWDPSRRFATADGLVDYRNVWDRSTFVRDMTSRLSALVEKIYRLRPATRIVLSDVVPIGISICDRVTGQYSRSIQQLVGSERDRGRAMVFASPWRAFTVRAKGGCFIRDGLMSDDTHHPTPAGYQQMAQIYRTATMRVLTDRG